MSKTFIGYYPWEQRKLKDILLVNSGRDYKHLSFGTIPVFGTGGYMLSVDDKLSDRDGIGLGRKGTINKPQYLNAPFWTVDTLFYLTSRDNNSLLFQYYVTQSINWLKFDESTGVPSLSKKTIENINKYMPNYDEQIKNGEFFKKIDRTIELHQRKINILEKQKEAYLISVLPNNKTVTPKLRFVHFKNVWQQLCVEDIASVKTGNKDTQDAIAKGSYDFYVRSPKIEKIDSYSYDGEAVLTVGDGVGVGNVFHYVNGKFDYHQRVYKISDFKNYNSLFFYYYFSKNFKYESRKYNAKTSVDSVRRDMITKMKIPNTYLKEQVLIGQFLRKIDDIIVLHQRRLNVLIKIKQVYLTKMFI